MADIRNLIAKMATNGGGGGGGDASSGAEVIQNSAPKKTNAKQTIEKTYQKKSQLEHILLRPDTYIGSVEKASELMWIYDAETDKIIQKQIEYVPGLYKIFDEILVNAADNKQRDKTMNTIKINIDQEGNTISVWNNGQGIPVTQHKEEKMFVPTMIFGHLLTSSNYNDEEQKVTGGRNGYGAKLCNIFSTKFIVETASKEYKRQFKQTWGNNMSKVTEPKVKEYGGEDFTKITFSPDLAKFKMDKLDDNIVGLMSRRAYDVAASCRGVKVFLNNKKVPIKNFKDYIELYIKNRDDDGNVLGVVYENPSERWEVGLTTSDKGFQQMSFVNSIATTKGGKHVDHVSEMIIKQLIEIVKKKNKGGAQIKPAQVKYHMWVFVNCLIVNPTFDSQTKENMTLQVKNFGSKCTLSPTFMNQVAKSGIVEYVLRWAKFKAQDELSKTSGKKQTKLKGIPKLEDANEAGSKNSLKCTLILTEGDSAKSLAVSGLGVIGRDYYGVFPLKGKLLNVREATHKQILENAEINNLIKIVGLQYKKKYNNDDDMKTLRYGKIMIMTDQDQDGSHIKGLLINFIHFNWPELVRRDFLEEFITPIVKASKRNEKLSFYSLPEFEEWKQNTVNHSTYRIKYYKGLGTSTSQEAKEYFQDMNRHRIRFRYGGQQDDDHIVLAFSKKHIEHRKEWLTNFMVENRRRKEIGLPEKYLYTKNTKSVSYTDFVNLELVLFSNADNIRSIPSVVDGFKPGQRKVMFTCIKRNDKREVKVAQLSGSVAELSAYHHGEVSLCMTIVNLAQNFVGSNNINLLQPIGSFGTRLSGGKDSASPRYINTKMSPLARLIFHPSDDNLLKYEYDDNLKIEPFWYIPILPMILVNGADGIGTGWMTKIPNYNPREIVRNLRAMLAHEEPTNMIPWYKGFIGTIEDVGDQRYIISGEVGVVGTDKLEITELPVGTWTQKYKEDVLEPLLHGSDKIKAVIADYKEYNTDTTIKFVVTCLPGQLTNLEKEGIHKIFKLQSTIVNSSMCAFDDMGVLKRYNTVMEILREFYTVRLDMYDKRKKYIEGMLKAEADRLSDQARFIMEKCDNTLVVENKKRTVIIAELIRRGYNPDPVQVWKEKIKADDDEEAPAKEDEGDDDDENEGGATSKKPADSVESFKEQCEVKKFDYLLGMSMWMLTEERKQALLAQRDSKLTELSIIKNKTKEDLWKEDLNVFMEKLDEVEEKERKEAAGQTTTTKKKTDKPAGRKKVLLQEAMPSPVAKRIEPVITEELRKKIQKAVSSKESKVKKEALRKENTIDEDEDEIDSMMSKEKKTLRQKLGTPEDAERKGKKKKVASDGLKQTKLNFSKKSPDSVTNGSPKGKGRKKLKITDDSSDDDLNSDGDDFTMNHSNSDVPVVRERTTSRRAAAAKVRYRLSDDDEDEKFSDDEEEVLVDNEAVKNVSVHQEVMDLSSESESENKPQRRQESSEDLFDSLVGKTPPAKATKRLLSDSGDDFLNDASDEEKKAKTSKKKKNDDGSSKPKPAKKQNSKEIVVSSDDESEPTKKPAQSKKKKKGSDEDDDFDLPAKKTKGRAKKYLDSDSGSDFDPKSVPMTTGRSARNVKKSKYVFDEDDSSD